MQACRPQCTALHGQIQNLNPARLKKAAATIATASAKTRSATPQNQKKGSASGVIAKPRQKQSGREGKSRSLVGLECGLARDDRAPREGKERFSDCYAPNDGERAKCKPLLRGGSYKSQFLQRSFVHQKQSGREGNSRSLVGLERGLARDDDSGRIGRKIRLVGAKKHARFVLRLLLL
jgi:hypothetical protein